MQILIAICFISAISSEESNPDFFDKRILFEIGLFIVGGILGFLTKTWLVRYQSRDQNFIVACNQFRSTIVDVIDALEQSNPIKGETTQFVIEMSADKIRKSVGEFKLFLTGNKRRRFEKAWRKFYNQNYDPRKTKYSEEDMKKLAFKNINELLKFAKY